MLKINRDIFKNFNNINHAKSLILVLIGQAISNGVAWGITNVSALPGYAASTATVSDSTQTTGINFDVNNQTLTVPSGGVITAAAASPVITAGAAVVGGTITLSGSGQINVTGAANAISLGIGNTGFVINVNDNSVLSGTNNAVINAVGGGVTVNISGGTIKSTNANPLAINTSGLPTTINITNSPTITGEVTLGAVGDTLNIGTTIGAASANFTTGGTIAGVDTIKTNTAGTVFNVNNIIGGVVTDFNVGAGTTVNVNTGGSIDGAGTLTNAGKLVVNSGTTLGNTTALGNITNSGTMTLNGTVTRAAGKTITNNVGATLNVGADLPGAGGGLFTNHGILNVTAPVTMTSGGYTLGATGNHIITVTNGIDSKLTLSAGAATFTDGSKVQINAVGTPIKDQQKIVIVAGSAAATVDPTKITLNSTPVLSYVLAKNGNNVEATVTRKSATSLVSGSTATASANILNGVITAGNASADLSSVINAIDGLSNTSDINDAYSQLSPNTNAFQGGLQASLDVSGQVVRAASERLNLVRAGIYNMYAQNSTGYSAGAMQSNNSTWIKGLGSKARQKQRDDSKGYNANTGGLAVGLDKEIQDNIWAGLGVSYAKTRVKTKDLLVNHSKVYSYQATFYASYASEQYYVDGFLAFAFNRNQTSRPIKFGVIDRLAEGKFHSIQPSTKVASGYVYSFDNFQVVPNVSMQYTLLHQNKYNEKGAVDVNLVQIKSKNVQILEGGVGVKLAYLMKEQDNKVFHPEVHFMLLQDIINTKQETTSQFSGGGGNFTVEGVEPAKTIYNAGCGITYIYQDRVHFTASYDLAVKKKYAGHSGALAVRYMI